MQPTWFHHSYFSTKEISFFSLQSKEMNQLFSISQPTKFHLLIHNHRSQIHLYCSLSFLTLIVVIVHDFTINYSIFKLSHSVLIESVSSIEIQFLRWSVISLRSKKNWRYEGRWKPSTLMKEMCTNDTILFILAISKVIKRWKKD